MTAEADAAIVAAMTPTVLVVALLSLGAARAGPLLTADQKYKLPDDFLLGAGTSAIQTEGAWNTDGKGENVFDHYYHSKNASTSESSDVAADFYGHYKEDIALAAKIGLNVFRFSFSWSRIFPDGDTSQPANSMGVQHYHKVLDEMRNHNIEPMVTIFHFDYPQALEVKFGGWAGEEMIDVFVEYADFLFKEYGSKIKYWLTINEPELYCDTLAGGMLAPSTMTTPEKQNACLKNTILAHAKAHKIYEEKYKAKYKGLVGVGAGPRFYHGATNSEEDITAAENANVNTGIGLTIDPLVFGDYPEAVRDSRKAFTDEEKDLIKGRIDFVGVNMYGGQNASSSGGGGSDGPPGDGGSGGGDDQGPPPGDGGSGDGSGGNRPDSFGDVGSAWVLREMPLWIKKRYETNGRKLPVFITENGINSPGNTSAVDDWDTRAVYASAFLRELVAGINENGTNVIGFTAWSFIDTFEFHSYGLCFHGFARARFSENRIGHGVT
ncbi:uncharacterized protein LOC113210249 isoform X2 [Frankliniella occidentalis]|uniref:beta-glucosidase n=1 Tax=Frankliniella occidentalis TaxID=133901 RepID=A0A9C6UCJ7_FRAOC|nr:uncharacterized protein LOC113210249 isoform X2 [Frankliniella occidentalis]